MMVKVSRGKQEDSQPGTEHFSMKSCAIAFISSMLILVLHKSELSFPLAVAISGTIGCALGYWLPPKPAVSFLRYALAFETAMATLLIAVWPIPRVLRHLMPIQPAYALPLLVLSLPLYALLLKLAPGVRKLGFGKWVLGCVILAAALAVGVTIFPDV